MQNLCKPTITLFHDTRRALKDGSYPVKLRVTFVIITAAGRKHIQKYYATGFSLSVEQWTKVRGVPRTEELRIVKGELAKIEAAAIDVCQNYEVLTPDLFESAYLNYGTYSSVNDLFAEVQEKLKDQGRYGSEMAYRNALASLVSFAGRELILFGELTKEWLEKYEGWMIEKGRSISTIGMYLRALRAIYRLAIDKKVIGQELYPFGSNGYMIPSGKAFKRALTAEQKDALLLYETSDSARREALDFWMLSYYWFGLNMTDLLMLTWDKIVGDVVLVERAKTIRTKRDRTVIKIPVAAEAREILKRRSIRSINAQGYVFPVLEHGITKSVAFNRIKGFIKRCNKFLKPIGEELGLPFKLTTYSARHTFATTLKRKGVPTWFIQQAMGHESEATTENYFGTFLTEEAVEFAAHLSPQKEAKTA
jgi:integrase/recombinase XerD